MSEKKINIDMNLFKLPSKTRKKRSTEPKEGIKVKIPMERKKNETLKKKSILKMIRQHQEDRYKKLFEEKQKTQNNSENRENRENLDFNKEFKEAQIYLQSLTNKKEESNKNSPLNKTLKNYLNHPNEKVSESLLFHPTLDTFSVPSPQPAKHSQPIILQPALHNVPAPKYGCLKNGSLPTYRTFMNQTRKIPPTTNINPVVSNQPIVINGGTKMQHQPILSQQNNISTIENKLNNSINHVTYIRETTQKLEHMKQKIKPKRLKRKRTLRRTYKLGRSKTAPKVAVLVSNKTIRNNISTKSQLLKQTPIEEVKRFLIKRGLIKVGSITPNDVLRKMYECSVMMCGDVYNHNPDNLLYNFLNDIEK